MDSGNNKFYDQDFYTWTQQQAELLLAGKLDQLDIDNLAEEILSMGRSEYRFLVSRLTKLLSHLLKWQYQPERQSRSWRLTIAEQRSRVDDCLNDNTGLQQFLDEAFTKAYHYALLEAAKETDLPRKTFPATSPWTLEQIMQDEWLP